MDRQHTGNKITPPRMGNVFPRERLFRKLDQLRQRPVIWVCGPGGSGKSTLVASYLQACSIPCLWYLVDEGDGDVATLFHYFSIAARKASPVKKINLPHLSPDHLLTLKIFARRYFESFFAGVCPPFTIVFDDYHEVSEDSLFHDAILSGLHEIPHGINVIIISRRNPPASLSRLEANGLMEILDWNHLRLAEEETAGVIRLSRKDEPSGENVRLLQEKTQGWIAGLLLMLRHAKGADQVAAHPLVQTPAQVFEYFAEEAFQKVESNIKDFLLKTALLPTISAEMAQRLTGMTEAPRILADLNRNNFFTEKRLDAGNIYRYHPLFREFLLKKGDRTIPEAELCAVKKAAFAILLEHGHVEEAAQVAVGVGDVDGLQGLILQHAPSFLSQGRHETVRSWIEGIPQGSIAVCPGLLYWFGISLTPVAPCRSLDLFRNAFELYRQQGERTGMFLSWSRAADVSLQCMEFKFNVEWVAILNDILAADPSFPSEDVETQVTLSTFNAMSYTMTDQPEIFSWHEKAYALVFSEKKIEPGLRLMTAINLTIYYIWAGSIPRSTSTVNLLRSAENAGVSELVTQTIKTAEAFYCALTADCGRAIAIVREALQHASRCGIHVWDSHLLCHGLVAALSVEDWATVEEFHVLIQPALKTARPIDVSYYQCILGWEALLRGDFNVALEYFRSVYEHRTFGFLAAETMVLCGGAESLLLLGRREEGEEALSRAYGLASRMKSALLEFTCLGIDAQDSFERGDRSTGLERLARMLRVGRENGIVNRMWWRSSAMSRLCVTALENDIEPQYVQFLVRKRNLTPEKPPLHLDNWPWPYRITTLGTFSLERDGSRIGFSGKVQKKPLEMLKCLVALCGAETREGQIAELLWPDADGDTARNSFKVTLHRLRELLGTEKALQLKEGRLSIDRRQVWTDAWTFENLFVEAQIEGEALNEVNAVRLAKKAIDLYHGQFLPEDTDKPWAESCRTRLNSRYIHNIVVLGGIYRKTDSDKAISCYLQGLAVDDLAEVIYQNLMECYLSSGLRAEAIKTYKRCKKALAIALGVLPSPRTNALYEAALH